MRGIPKVLCGLTVIAVAAGVTQAHVGGTASAAQPTEKVPSQYLVTLRDGVIIDDFIRDKGHGNGNAKGHALKGIFRRAGNGYAIRFKGQSAAAELADLRADQRVARVEQDAYVTVGTVRPTTLWGLDRIDQARRPLDGALAADGTGAGIAAYVLDTGVRSDHAELAGRVRPGFSAYGTTEDCNGHGTHVAGTIAGSTVGVAPETAITAVRVIDCGGEGTLSDVLAGIDWIIQDHQPAVPAVLNVSLGTPYSDAFNQAIANAVADGLVVVAAAGNSGGDACVESPGSVPAAITVGATGADDRRASYSNLGACLDLFAPGDGILSAGIASPTSTAYLSGTSMAAPHVAGVAALVLQREPTLSVGAVGERIAALAATGVVLDPGAGSPNRLARVPALAADAPTSTTSPTRGRPGASGAADATRPGAARLPRPRIVSIHHDRDRLTIRFAGPRGVTYQLFRNGSLLAQTKRRALTVTHGPSRRATFAVRGVTATGLSPFSSRVLWHHDSHWIRPPAVAGDRR